MSCERTLLHKRSSVSGVKPTSADLQEGEIAVNTSDGKLFSSMNGNPTSWTSNDRHVISKNQRVIYEDYNMEDGYNGSSVGDVEIVNSATVNIPNDSLWLIIQ